MKNVDFSNVLLSIFSPEILLYPVKNIINPLTKNKNKLARSKSALNSRNNITQKNMKEEYIKNKLVTNFINMKKEEEKNNFIYERKINLYPRNEAKNNNNKNLMREFIIIKPKSSNNKNYYKIVQNKSLKNNDEPYKRYLSEKYKIEYIKKMKELENKYILESKRQKKLKFENDIRTKFQGYDFSKQRKKETIFEKLIKSKICEKKDENKKLEKNDIVNQFNTNFFLKMLNFEINEKKYMFLENKKLIPNVKYNDFKERFGIFTWNLKENPNFSTLINYISNK